jgi:hypothetical protein
MGYFAEIDKKNIVLRVIKCESLELCKQLFKGKWIETYSDIPNKPLAAIGYFYDSDLDAFIPPKPYSKWILNTDLMIWQPPFSEPDNESIWFWNDDLGDFEKIEPPNDE